MTAAPKHWEAIVVGSGFGGSIAAYRLAKAGRRVLVLERGRRYAKNDFPRDPTDVDALFWRRRGRRYAAGLYDLRFFSGIGCVVAAGVGGGSLVYANIHVRPDPVVFDDPRWPTGTDRAGLDPYYDRVAEMFEVAPVPAEAGLPKRDVFREAAERMGRDVFDPDQAVRWPEVHTSVSEPVNLCRFLAECELGCREGAKRTADKTYLAAAVESGAEVRPKRLVVEVRPVTAGFAVVHRDVDTGRHEVSVARRVVLAAGTLGTNELLLRGRETFLPGLGPTLGEGFSANGDFLGSIHKAGVDLSPNRGPDVTSVMRFFDEAPEFTLAAPTFNEAVMTALANLGQPSALVLRPFAPLLWRLLPVAVPFMFSHHLFAKPVKYLAPGKLEWRRSTNLFGIGRDDAGGRIHLTRRGIDVSWDYRSANAALINRQIAAMAELADFYNGEFAPLVFWNAFRRTITVHPLGGCGMSTHRNQGVVSPTGEVHGYPGLFVADGSVVPTSIGFHPAMTISALAERTADAVVASF